MELPDLDLVELQVRQLALPLAQPIASAIHSIDTIHVLWVELRDAHGYRGVGAAIAFRAGFVEAMRAILREVAHCLHECGQPSIAAVRAAMLAQINYMGLAGASVQAISTIDTALWVLAAERARLPLHRLLGSQGARLDAYHGHGLWLHTRGNALADEAAAYVDRGYRAVKMRVGCNDLGTDLDRIERVRRRIGDDVALMVDANQGCSLRYAEQLGAALRAYDIEWYEEPVLYTDVDGHAHLAATLAVPIATGQSEYLEHGMARYLKARACRVLMPDLCRMGGVTGWRNAAGLAAKHGVPVSNHLYVQFGQHLQAAIPNRTWVDTIDWLDPLFARPIRFEQGCIVLPDEPGLGVPVDDAAIERFTVAVG